MGKLTVTVMALALAFSFSAVASVAAPKHNVMLQYTMRSIARDVGAVAAPTKNPSAAAVADDML